MSKEITENKFIEIINPFIELLGEEFLINCIRFRGESDSKRNSHKLKISALYSLTSSTQREAFYKGLKLKSNHFDFPFSRLSKNDIETIRTSREYNKNLESNLNYIISES